MLRAIIAQYLLPTAPLLHFSPQHLPIQPHSQGWHMSTPGQPPGNHPTPALTLSFCPWAVLQATPAVHRGFFPVAQQALLSALAQPLLTNPGQLFQIVSMFLRAAAASHPPHSCSVDDSHLLCSWAWLSQYSSHSNPSAHLSQVPS